MGEQKKSAKFGRGSRGGRYRGFAKPSGAFKRTVRAALRKRSLVRTALGENVGFTSVKRDLGKIRHMGYYGFARGQFLHLSRQHVKLESDEGRALSVAVTVRKVEFRPLTTRDAKRQWARTGKLEGLSFRAWLSAKVRPSDVADVRDDANRAAALAIQNQTQALKLKRKHGSK